MDEPFDASLFGALQKDMSAVDVCMGKAIRVAEAQIHMRLRGKVHHSIDVIALYAIEDFRGVRQVAMVKRKVALVIEDSGVVESRTVVQLVKRYNVVSVGICQGKMTNDPGSACDGTC